MSQIKCLLENSYKLYFIKVEKNSLSTYIVHDYVLFYECVIESFVEVVFSHSFYSLYVEETNIFKENIANRE